MFCGKCGAKNENNAKFCTECGAILNGVNMQEDLSSVTTDLNDKNRKVGMIAVFIIALVGVVMIWLLFGGRSYKAAIEQYFDATFEADAEAIMDLLPEELMDYILEEEGYELDECMDEMNEELQEALDSLDNYLGENWHASYEILNVEDMSSSDLEDLREAYEDENIDMKVSAAKTVEVEITVKAEDSENSNTMDLTLIKVGRSWYLDAASMRGLY